MEHIDLKTMIGDQAGIGNRIGRLGDAGFQEVIYTPSGPDVERELRAFASVPHPLTGQLTEIARSGHWSTAARTASSCSGGTSGICATE